VLKFLIPGFRVSVKKYRISTIKRKSSICDGSKVLMKKMTYFSLEIR